MIAKAKIIRFNNPLYGREIGICLDKCLDRGRHKGLIVETKKRWDIKDQKEFEKVPIENLLSDPYYLGIDQYKCVDGCGWVDTKNKRPNLCANCGSLARPDLFPSHRQDIIDLWEARKHGVTTAVFQEGIGSGKTTKFCAITWLQITEVLTKVDPLRYYGLMKKGQGISFVCMSRNESLAREVTFLTMLPFFSCGFYDDYFPPQIDLVKIMASRRFPNRLRFPKKVVLFPGTGSALSAVGYNLFGGGVDETNYLEVVDDSKKAVSGEKYDAAEDMYNTVIARMKSRFDPIRLRREGKLPGLLVMFSNPKCKGDFTSKMEYRSYTDKSIFFRKRCTWEAHPPERYCGETFNFDIHNRKIVG